MARETTNQGYIDAQSYATDPDNVTTPDSLHQEYERGINSYSLSQDGDSAKLNSILTADTINFRVGFNDTAPFGTIHAKAPGQSSGASAVNSNANQCVLEGTSNAGMTILTGNTSNANIFFGDQDDTDVGAVYYNHTTDTLVLRTNATDTIFCDGNGNIGLAASNPFGRAHVRTNASGASAVNANADEFVVENDSNSGMTILGGAAGNSNIYFGDVNDTDIGALYYNHTTDVLVSRANNTDYTSLDSSGNLLALVDNTQTLGGASNRWSEVFAGNGTINTSDSREKTVQADDDKVLDAIDSLSIKAFKWNDAIASKGEANARVHYGVLAQEVKSAFEAQGLVAEDYGVLCYDEWAEETDAEGNVTKEAGNRYGVRYDELYALKIAALERKTAAL